MPYKDKIKRNECVKRSYHKKLINGICVRCSEPPINGTVMCLKHLLDYRNQAIKKNERYRKYCVENRKCTRCGTPLEEEEGRSCMNCSGKRLRKEMVRYGKD
jgi:hypothetical protein